MNERALIGDDLQVHVGAVRVDPLDLSMDATRHLDGVRITLLADGESNRRKIRDLGVTADVLVAEIDLRNIADPDGVAVHDGDDGFGDLIDAFELPHRTYIQIPQTFAYISARQGNVLTAQSGHDITGRQLVRDQTFSIQIDVDGSTDATPNIDGTHTTPPARRYGPSHVPVCGSALREAGSSGPPR